MGFRWEPSKVCGKVFKTGRKEERKKKGEGEGEGEGEGRNKRHALRKKSHYRKITLKERERKIQTQHS
jgi:hypothetical protein